MAISLSQTASVATAQGTAVEKPGTAAPAIASPAKSEAGAKKGKPEFVEDWQAIYIGNARVGYGRSIASRSVRDGQPVLQVEIEQSMAMTRFGQTVTLRTLMKVDEKEDGSMLGFDFSMHNPPARPERTIGRVEGEKLIIENEVNGQTRKETLAWDTSIKGYAYHERVLRETPLKPGGKLSLKVFDPTLRKVNEVTLKAIDFEEVALLGNTSKRLLKVNASFSAIPFMTSTEYVDEGGETWKSTLPVMQVTTYRVSRDEALKKISGELHDLAVATLVKVPGLTNPHTAKKGIFRVRIPGEEVTKLLPSGSGQTVGSTSKEGTELIIEGLRPAAATAESASPGDEFLKPSQYIQSDDPLVIKHANAACGAESDPWKRCVAMEAWVQKNLKQKNFSTLLASAGETAKTLSGDCTEHAMLLAAMLRAKNIPSRITVGLVHVPQGKMGGHMWTEAYVQGMWIPIDGTLGLGGIGCGHIKFADVSFADGQEHALTAFFPVTALLAKIQIELVRIER